MTINQARGQYLGTVFTGTETWKVRRTKEPNALKEWTIAGEYLSAQSMSMSPDSRIPHEFLPGRETVIGELNRWIKQPSGTK